MIVKRISRGAIPHCSLRDAMADAPFDVLSRFERFAFRFMRWLNRSWIGAIWQRFFITPLVGFFIARRLQVSGLERLAGIPPGASILMVANHRTFFDQFVLAWILISRSRLQRRVSFPVRGNFFYEHPLGLIVCTTMSGGSMF